MKKISDPKRIAQCLRTTGLQDQFDTPDLPFLLFSYEKHELIASQWRASNICSLWSAATSTFSVCTGTAARFPSTSLPKGGVLRKTGKGRYRLAEFCA